MSTRAPQQIILHKISRRLEVIFADGIKEFSAESLRAHSPSSDNRQKKVVPQQFSGISILSIEPVGQYAIKLLFSDGHRSGIYTWEMLHALETS